MNDNALRTLYSPGGPGGSHEHSGTGRLTMITFLLVVALMVSTYGWIKYMIALHVIIYYLEIRHHDLPSDEEIEQCYERVVRTLLHLR